MKGIVYAVIGALVLIVVIRRTRGAHRSPARAAVRGVARRLGGHRPLGDTGLVAAREIRERLRGRFFRVITLILLAVIAAAIVIPTLHSSTRTVVKVGVVGTLGPTEVATVDAALAHVRLHGKVTSQPGDPAARAALRAHRVTVVIDRGSALLVATGTSGGSTTAATAATAIASALGVERAFHAAGLSASQADVVLGARPLPIHSVASRTSGAARGTSVIGLIFIFILLTQYLAWTLVGVMEEKSSRVVEVLLATVRPVQLLGGKVLGIGLVALLQAGLVVAFALVLADAVGSDLLKGTAPVVVVASLVWLVLAYAFYSWVFAAAGSMAERQDQAQSLSLPLSVPIIVGYVLALINAGPGPVSLFMKVLAYLPPTAPFGMPLLVAKGEVAWWGFLVAALVSVASTVAVARFAAAVYRRAVLRTGRRLGVREVITARG
jgi:ABC-2 type transport system permease protein